MDIDGMTPEEYQAHQAKLRADLYEKDIETYYAVNQSGHSDGWAGLTQLLTDKIHDTMDVIRKRQEETEGEIDSAKLRGRIDGLRDALQLLNESNQ